MNNTKFTQAPWRVGGESCDLNNHINIDAPNHFAMAQVVVQMEDDENINPILMANANLIAAAPELYEALEKFSYYFGAFVQGRPQLQIDIQKAEAALSKARGK